MLAIAAPTFNEPSETFVRDHVRMLAPGETILLGRAGGGAEAFGCPALEISARHPARRLLGRIAFVMRSRVRSAPLGVRPPRLSGADRKRAAAFLREHRPTALLAEFGPTGVEFAAAAQDAEVPLFVHFHGLDATVLPEYEKFRAAYRALFAVAQGVIVTTPFMRRQLLALGCPAAKLFVCPCGVNTNRFAPSGPRPRGKRILMVCRLIPQKGPLLAIKSFAKALAAHPDSTLDIIGEGPLRKEAEATVKALGVVGRVEFHGARPHSFVLERLNAADLLIQHCVTVPRGGMEAFGLSIVEAMACEVPLVSTRHGGIADTVQHGVTGLLVEEGDVDGMAAAMAALLSDPDRAAAMGAAGRARVLEHYTQQKARDRLRAIMGLPPLSQAVTPAASDCKSDESLANSRVARRH